MTSPSVKSCAPFKRLKLAVFACLAVAFSGSGASAGFLEDIFGDPDPAPRAAAPGRAPQRNRGASSRVKSELHFMPGSTARSRDHQGRGSVVAKADDGSSSAGSRPVTAALCAPEATVSGASAPALLAYDKTLRNGDIMVTEAGLQIFRGHAACPHGARDFVALSSASMPRSQRSNLLALEEAMKRPRGYMLSAKFDR
jgi:hypothetical protein